MAQITARNKRKTQREQSPDRWKKNLTIKTNKPPKTNWRKNQYWRREVSRCLALKRQQAICSRRSYMCFWIWLPQRGTTANPISKINFFSLLPGSLTFIIRFYSFSLFCFAFVSRRSCLSTHSFQKLTATWHFSSMWLLFARQRWIKQACEIVCVCGCVWASGSSSKHDLSQFQFVVKSLNIIRDIFGNGLLWAFCHFWLIKPST